MAPRELHWWPTPASGRAPCARTHITAADGDDEQVVADVLGESVADAEARDPVLRGVSPGPDQSPRARPGSWRARCRE